jgi:DUF4097 and DUF4098 domain-containing protein YvlB
MRLSARNGTRCAAVLGVTALLASSAYSLDTRKEFRLDIASGGAVTLTNNAGSIHLKSNNGHQVIIAYTAQSNKVEVDQSSANDHRRIEITTHALPDLKPTAEEARVDFEISVPAGISVTVNAATATITAEDLSGDISFSSDTGQITLHDVGKSDARKSSVQVRTVTGMVNLSNINGEPVEVTSSAGAVQLANVTGPKVKIGTGSGNITYSGDCSGMGNYILTTHTGAIDVSLPQTASVDITARSVSGDVQNEFPLSPKMHTSFTPQAGRSFTGTSNSGASSVQLQSFSGRIRVKKQ